MTSSTLATLLTDSVTTGWGYITALFSETLTGVLGFIVVGGIFALVVGGVAKLFRRK